MRSASGSIDSIAVAGEAQPRLPDGARLISAVSHRDSRGTIHEVYHRDRYQLPTLIQWNIVECEARTVRGVHAHVRHTDYLLIVSGRFVFGLQDIRPQSPTRGLAVTLELDPHDLRGLLIPPGVAHAFLCSEAGAQFYGMSHVWDASDDLLCRWDDPALGFRLPVEDPIVSERDAGAGSLAQMIAAYRTATA